MKRNEPVSHIMTADPVTVHVASRPSEVRKLLSTGEYHHVPVVSGAALVGMISLQDLVRAGYADGVDVRALDATLDHAYTIEQLMTASPVVTSSQTTIRDAATLLAGSRFHSLPVVDDGKLVGILTTTDLLRYLLAQY